MENGTMELGAVLMPAMVVVSRAATVGIKEQSPDTFKVMEIVCR